MINLHVFTYICVAKTWQVAGVHLSALVPGVSSDAIDLITVSTENILVYSPNLIVLEAFHAVMWFSA